MSLQLEARDLGTKIEDIVKELNMSAGHIFEKVKMLSLTRPHYNQYSKRGGHYN